MDAEKQAGAALEAAVQDALQQLDPESPAEIARLRADLRLQHTHPGEYVAYIDSWGEGADETPRLSRTVIAVANDMKGLDEKLSERAALGQRETHDKIFRVFVDDPDAGIPDDRFEISSTE